MPVRDTSAPSPSDPLFSKVPAVTFGFWIIKVLATTLGETGGDTVTMTWLGETSRHANQHGYLIGTAIFAALLVLFVTLQVRARRFDPWLYWATIIASTTAGTTLADFADRSLGIGYAGGSLLLTACVLLSLFAWWRALGTVDVNTVTGPRQEAFYWITITFSQTLGTALGDWAAIAAWAMPVARWCSRAPSSWSRSSTARPICRASCCSGRRSSSPVRSAPPPATFWTSPMAAAGWGLAGRPHRP
jgi:uncharacterized membrane-anchored protein